MDHGRRDGRQGVIVTKFDLLQDPLSGEDNLTARVLTLTDTVSFSLTIGTTPIYNSSLNVLTAFKYLVR